VDNPDPDTEYPTLDRESTLIKLYELRDQIERAILARGVTDPRSVSERHQLVYGHRLAHGCCRVPSTSRRAPTSL
jgi:hypothetical protein